VGSKENFLKYQYLVEAKINNKLPESLDKQEFKDPYEDQHCEYLEVCQKKIDDQLRNPSGDPEIEALWTNAEYSNPFKAQKEKWRAKYPKGGSSSSASSSSTTSSTTSTTQR